MKKNLKKFILTVLSLTIISQTITPIFAQDIKESIVLNRIETNIKIIVDNDTKRIVENTDLNNNLREIIIFDKKENIITTNIYELNNTQNLIKSSKLNLNDIQYNNDIKDNDENYLNDSRYSSHYQNTFSNYEYRKISNYEYKLRKQNNYKILSIENNANDIDKYVTVVDDLNKAEIHAIGLLGISTVVSIVDYFLMGLTTAQIIAILGTTGASIQKLGESIQNCNRIWGIYIE